MKKKVLIIAAALVVVLGTAVGVGVYFIIQSLSHPPEETAKFLPMETSFYVSMNLRPGAGQLMKAREIRDLFKENPKFEEKLDELYEDIEEETGINVEEDLFPWLGPEIAMAIPTFEGIDETPEFVAFIGATDTAAAETFLRKLIAFGEESNGTEYEEGVTRGFLTFVVDPSDDVSTHIVLTDDYIVIATGAETLESTLDRMDSGQDQDRSSLFDNPGFQEAREAAESPRFGIMYVDIAGIIDQLGEDFDEEDVESLRVFSDQLPDFIVASLAFIEKGIRVSTSFDRPDQLFVTASTNSVGSAGRAPEDTVALLSFVGVQDAWKKFRDEVADLPYLDLDEALHEIESDIGIDIEQDIFGWMTGELAFAMLLPGGVPFSSDEIHANAYVEFDDRAKALSSMEKIQDAIEDSGVEFSVVDVEGTDAVVMDLGDDQGPPNLTPGYVVLDNYVVIGTTLTSLRQAVEAERGDIPSLRESSAFSRPLAAAGNSTDFMIYGNIKRIVKEVLDQLDETELEEYGETAEPFVEPLEAFLLGVAVEEDIFTLSTVITFAATTDTPTPEPTPIQTGTTTDTPTPEPTPTQTGTPTDTPTPEPTPTQTGTPTDTPTPEPTPTQTGTPTDTPTPEPTPTQTATPTDTRQPESPANVRYALEGSSIRVSWDAVDGADYYNVYHDDFFDSGCTLRRDGSPGFCEELATNVVGTTYVHADPDSAKNYYWVAACNSGGCSDIDSENPAMPIETIPTGPANVRYALEGSSIRVSWDAVDGADYYNVYHDDFFDSGCTLRRDGSPGFCEELATNVAETTYVHASPDEDENYYWVVACNSGGCSEIDSENPAMPIETIPTGPANVRYALEGSSIRVSWDAVDGADYYNVYHDDFFDSGCRPSGDGSPSFCEELATNVAETTYAHADPDSAKNYYWVAACNSGGCSDIDSENPAMPIETIPTGPANVRYALEGSSIRVSWDAVDGADYYNVYHDDFFDSGCTLRRDGSPGFCEELATNVAETTYVHASPDEDENYYWVAACNSGGCSEIDSENPAMPIETIPTGPANVRYALEGSSIRVSWDAVDGADYYNVYHDDFFDSGCRLSGDGSPSFCEELATNVAETTYAHADPDSAKNYYWVAACNSGGCSDIDSENPAMPIETIPTGPANVRYALEGSSIRVSWDAVDGADYYNVYHDDFFDSGCTLRRDGSPGFCEELATNVVGTTYVHADPDSAKNYYWVVACNSGGCSEIDSENPAMPIETIPTGPANVRYALEGSSIRVSWDAVDGADYYNVYHDDFFDSGCRLSGDGSPSFCEELATNVAETTYAHADPDSAKNYYWVVACNSGGCSEIDSENPAMPIETIPNGPANVRYALEGSAIRVSWDAVDGADYYNVYHDDFFDSGCTLRRDGSPSFCEELATNVAETTYVHASPDEDENYYWVVACNSGGCSEIDSENPAMPSGTGATPTPSPQGFAPVDQLTFNSRMVGSSLNAGSFTIGFASAGRFEEDGRIWGSYSYSNTGPNMGTLTLTYDDGEYGGSCELRLAFDSETAGPWRYSCNSGNQDQGDWRVSITDSAVGRELEFSEGESTTRSIPENTPAGINVGLPVSAVGSGGVTYAMSGPDAESFVILPGTGQVRTRDSVVYDYETKNRYAVTVGVADDSGGSDTIEVTILIEDLVPACKPLRNLRTNHDEQRLTVRWNPSPETDGRARPLGYETEIRRGESGPWTDRRTFLGRNISAMIYGGLDNGIGYQVRARPINAEGDCGWSPPLWGIPTDVLTPRFPIDRFGTEPVGAPDRNWRFLTQERCRHTSNGVTLDADCTYENTGPDTSRIFLEFDDPSRGSCEITLAYSSLTAGSFIDECFDAGVNTEVPFDRSFRMPRSGPQTEDDPAPPPTEAESQRAPRSEDEFNALVLGRDDLIPGLSFRCFACFQSGGGVDLGPGWATRFEYDSHGRPYREIPGKYTYRNTGPSQGVLTFEGNDENTYVFTLDVEPSGNMRVRVTDPDGDVTVWPGMLHADLTLGAQPVLLPIPPSWSAAIAIETDAAPDDYLAFLNRLESYNPPPTDPFVHDPDVVWETLFGADAIDAVERVAEYGNSTGYRKIGRNRAQITITFDDHLPDGDDYSTRPWSSEEQEFVNSEWVFDITFLSDDSVLFTATRLQEGQPPVVRRGFIDLTGGRVNLNEFPPELLLPNDPPQASGEDRPGVEVAAALTANRIGGADIQVFQVSDPGIQPAAYRPGDWLEPKDGSDQRMMIVGVGQIAAAARLSPPRWEAATLAYTPSFLESPVFALPAVLSGEPAVARLRLASSAPRIFESSRGINANLHANADPAITQLSVVCMQRDHGIPTRGARYFSKPKAAEGPVQMCQRECVLNEPDNIQECVWKCEEN